MKLQFQKNELLNGINIVTKAIPSKTTMNILECILIDAATNEIRLTCNDLELGIETKVNGSILERGKIALDAKLFFEIIRKLPENDSDVIITSNERFNTIIECENAFFTIQGRDGEEFAGIPYIEKNQYVSLTQFTLKEAIRQTIFSIAPNDSNKLMAGELMEVKGNIMKITSLDGHRISIRSITLKDHYDDQKVIIPGKTLNEIGKILSGDNEKEILIFFSRNHILFEFDDTTVISRLLEGEYFKIDHMLSSDFLTKFKVNRRDFMDSIDRSMVLIRDSDRKPIIMDVHDTNLNMSIKSSFGSMSADVTINKAGKDIKIAFNPKFLMDALRVIDDEEVDIYMMNPKSPCFIRDEAGTYIYLILPVNFIG